MELLIHILIEILNLELVASFRPCLATQSMSNRGLGAQLACTQMTGNPSSRSQNQQVISPLISTQCHTCLIEAFCSFSNSKFLLVCLLRQVLYFRSAGQLFQIFSHYIQFGAYIPTSIFSLWLIDADADADAVTPSSNTGSYTRRSVSSSLGGNVCLVNIGKRSYSPTQSVSTVRTERLENIDFW